MNAWVFLTNTLNELHTILQHRRLEKLLLTHPPVTFVIFALSSVLLGHGNPVATQRTGNWCTWAVFQAAQTRVWLHHSTNCRAGGSFSPAARYRCLMTGSRTIPSTSSFQVKLLISADVVKVRSHQNLAGKTLSLSYSISEWQNDLQMTVLRSLPFLLALQH